VKGHIRVDAIREIGSQDAYNAIDNIDGGSTLTAREKRIALMLAADFDYQEIAIEVPCKMKTVRTHVSNIRKKLGLIGDSQSDIRKTIKDALIKYTNIRCTVLIVKFKYVVGD